MHAAPFQAPVDHDRDRAVNSAAAHRIARLVPGGVGAQPRPQPLGGSGSSRRARPPAPLRAEGRSARRAVSVASTSPCHSRAGSVRWRSQRRSLCVHLGRAARMAVSTARATCAQSRVPSAAGKWSAAWVRIRAAPAPSTIAFARPPAFGRTSTSNARRPLSRRLRPTHGSAAQQAMAPKAHAPATGRA